MESKYPVNDGHSAIVKFEGDSCEEFSQILSCLKEYFAASRHPVHIDMPLPLEELVATAGLLGDFLKCGYLLDLIGRGSSSITIRQGNIYFIHQSTKDYLTTNCAEKSFPSGIHEEHGVLIGRSLAVMFRTLCCDNDLHYTYDEVCYPA